MIKNVHHLSAINLLNPFQSAYPPEYSTETDLLKMVNGLLPSFLLLASLHLSPTFDTIDHNILLHRRQNDFGHSDTVLEWFS